MEIYAILKDGAFVGSAVFKRKQSVTCIVRLLGVATAQARADGGGYDRTSAAFEAACAKLGVGNPLTAAIAAAGDGCVWDAALMRAGYSLATIPTGDRS